MLKSKQIRLRTVAVLMSVSVLIAVLGSYYVFSQPPAVEDITDIYLNPPMSPYQLIVGKYNSTFFYVQNGTTGQYMYLFNDASNAVNNASDILHTTYGSALIHYCKVATITGVVLHNGYWVFDENQAVTYTVDADHAVQIDDRANGEMLFYRAGGLLSTRISYGAGFLNMTGGTSNTIYCDTIVAENNITGSGPASGGGGTASYIINKYSNGSTYSVKCSDWTIETVSTNASEVFNTARANLPTAYDQGIIFICAGSYSLSSPFIVGPSTRLVGEGSDSVTLTASTNINLITITSCAGYANANWEISGVYLDLAGYNGHCIYGSDAHSTSKTTLIRDVSINDIASGYCGIWINNPMNMQIQSVRMSENDGTGLKLTSTSASTIYGNSNIEGVRVGVSGTTAVGFNFSGYDTSHPMNLLLCDRLMVVGSDGASQIGLYMNCCMWNVFDAIDMESVGTGVYLNGVNYQNQFYGGFVASCISYGFRLSNYARMNLIEGVYITAGTGVPYSDENTARYTPNDLVSCRFYDATAGDLVVLGNCTNAEDNKYLNPIGVIALPFSSYVVTTRYTCRPDGGDVAAPVSARSYQIIGTDMLIRISGGTVSNIEIDDNAGATVSTGWTNGTFYVPIDYRITVTYSVAPTVVVSGN